LLQAHFSRVILTPAVAGDQRKILPDALRLLQAMVDVLSSKGWLSPAIACMEMSQMVTQGIWNSDSPLLQLPHLTPEHVKILNSQKVETVFDFLDMDDDVRVKCLKLPAAKLQDIARACNAYPNIDVKYEVEDAEDLHAGAPVTVHVDLERDTGDDDENMEKEKKEEGGSVSVVFADRYPQLKHEGWWLVIGEPSRNELLTIKRIAIKKSSERFSLQFNAPPQGAHKLTISLMCDSYLGADQEYEVEVNIKEALAEEQEE